ncbi:MAG TPA: helix-turn-helix domain-containing protein [Candidatus Anammoximicrobium sp.]|nr:helix-turn-helix domain-containing protein [Candidatus Anammoximicrobium sp.]
MSSNTPPIDRPTAKLPDRDYYSVSELAAVLAVDPMKILGWIHRGELRAINVAESATGRPRWRVPRKSWEAFTAARTNQAPVKPPRRKRERYVMEFY